MEISHMQNYNEPVYSIEALEVYTSISIIM